MLARINFHFPNEFVPKWSGNVIDCDVSHCWISRFHTCASCKSKKIFFSYLKKNVSNNNNFPAQKYSKTAAKKKKIVEIEWSQEEEEEDDDEKEEEEEEKKMAHGASR